MIAAPLNDHTCLSHITDLVRDLVQKRDPAFVELAEKVGTTEGLALYLQGLPQRNDDGDPSDGPRAEACTPSQRVRLSPVPADPNCVERAAIFVGVAELLDPEPVRQLKTTMTDAGLHTYPVENRYAVRLDPTIPRNALNADLFQSMPLGSTFSAKEAIDWLVVIAEDAAARAVGGVERLRAAHRAMYDLFDGAILDERAIDDIAYACALAIREARNFGAAGRALIREVIREVIRALGARMPQSGPDLRNALSLQIGPYKFSPNWNVLGRLGKVGLNLGTDIGRVVLQQQLASMGLSPVALSALEHEFNRAGLTLGALAPQTPSLAALALLPALSSLGGTKSTAKPAAGKSAQAAAAATAASSLAAPVATRELRNALIATPGNILAEMNITNEDILALGRDIRESFRRPFERELLVAEQRFTKEHGKRPSSEEDYAKVHASMNPVPTAADLAAKSYQGAFVHNWGQFEREWQAWFADNRGLSSRMWGATRDTALDYRKRAQKWRDELLARGGVAQAPAPQMPENRPWLPSLGPNLKTAAIVAGGVLTAAIVLPPLLRRS